VGLVPGTASVGVVAQEIERIFPELVTVGEDGFRRVDYGGLAALAVLGLQQLRAKCVMLEKRLDRLSKGGKSPRVARNRGV
jgi:hypothetical protein